MKRCTCCGIKKDFKEFIKNGTYKGKQLYRSECSACRRRGERVEREYCSERNEKRPKKNLKNKMNDKVFYHPKPKYTPLDIPDPYAGRKARIIKEGVDGWDWSIYITSANPSQKTRLCMDDELEGV